MIIKRRRSERKLGPRKPVTYKDVNTGRKICNPRFKRKVELRITREEYLARLAAFVENSEDTRKLWQALGVSREEMSAILAGRAGFLPG